MSTTFLLSIGLGAGIGLLYSWASRTTHRLAVRSSDRRFVSIVLAGVMIRMFAAVTLVVLVLVLVPVDVGLFVISFLLVFAGGMAHEVVWLHRHVRTSQKRK